MHGEDRTVDAGRLGGTQGGAHLLGVLGRIERPGKGCLATVRRSGQGPLTGRAGTNDSVTPRSGRRSRPGWNRRGAPSPGNRRGTPSRGNGRGRRSARKRPGGPSWRYLPGTRSG